MNNFKSSKVRVCCHKSNHANGDSWNSIYVVYNARPEAVEIDLDAAWQIVLEGDTFYPPVKDLRGGKAMVPAISMFIAFK